MPQIFVVEDDEAIRIELVQLLERNGYEVRCAERYEHVVDEVRAAEPDLVWRAPSPMNCCAPSPY